MLPLNLTMVPHSGPARLLAAHSGPARLLAALLLAACGENKAVHLRGGPVPPAPAPEHIDHEAVERFSRESDIDGLHKSLVAAFNASARVQGHRVVQLRDILTARGAGFTYSSAYKIEHDMEQLKHIADTLGGEQAKEIREEILPKYEALLAKIPPLHDLQRYSVSDRARARARARETQAGRLDARKRVRMRARSHSRCAHAGRRACLRLGSRQRKRRR